MLWHSALPLSVLLLAGSQAAPTDECPILGPAFPPNFDVSSTSAFRNAVAAFPGYIESLFSSGAVNRTHSSFTIDVFSAATNKSLYTYRHKAPALNGTLNAGVLDDKTIFRTGSVSKLFTAYAILAHGGMGILEDPVTKYLPSLAGNPRDKPLERIIWEDVTVGALMSHQGGTGGVPLDIAGKCAVDPPSPECTPDAFLAIMRSKRPVFPVFGTTLYSDAGYATLGLVLENMTGLPYPEALRRILIEPLGLNGTLTTEPLPDGFNGIVIPGGPEVSTWGSNNSVTTPSGGVYANNEDLRTLGLSILHSKLLTPAATRSWLKPKGHTASLTTSVGLLWEIERLALNVSAASSRTRIADLHTKMGGNNGYGAAFALSPDHGLGFSILVAGLSAADRYPLRNAVGEYFVTAAEHGAAEHAARRLPGTFAAAAPANGSQGGGSNLTLTVDPDRPGLGLAALFLDGADVRGNLSFPAVPPGTELAVRLYPTNPAWSWPAAAAKGNGTAAAEQISFRAVVQVPPLAPRSAAEGGQGLFDMNCAFVWTTAGFLSPVDEFVLEFVDGRLQSVTSVGLERRMMRVG